MTLMDAPVRLAINITIGYMTLVAICHCVHLNCSTQNETDYRDDVICGNADYHYGLCLQYSCGDCWQDVY